MKRIAFILICLVSLAYAQTPPGNYTQINQRYLWEAGAFKGLTIPAGTTPALRSGQWPIAGAVYLDSTGTNKGLYAYYDGGWNRVNGVDTIYNNATDDSLVYIIQGNRYAVPYPPQGTTTIYANGLSLVNDTAKLGSLTTGLTDSVTFIQVPANAKYAQFDPQPTRKLFVIHNRPYDSVKNNTTAGRFPYWLTHGSNQLLIMERDNYERLNDTANLQYSGILTTKHTYEQDHNSTRYDSATGKETTLQNGGLDAGYTFFPAKNIKFRPSPFGNHGGTIYATTGIGKDSSFTINLLPSTVAPVPWAPINSMFSFNSSVPLNKQRIIRNHDGAFGTAGIASWWKSGQGESDFTADLGSKMDRHADFFSVGGMYLWPVRNISGKANILNTSKVDTAVGFYSHNKYTDLNEVANGYGFVQAGTEDANVFQGTTRFGGTGAWYNRTEFVPNRKLWVAGSAYINDTLSIGANADAINRLKVVGKASFGSNKTTSLSKVYMSGYDTATTASAPSFNRVLHVDRRLTLLDSTSINSNALSAMVLQGFWLPDTTVTAAMDYQANVLGLATSVGFLAKPGVVLTNVGANTPLTPNTSITGNFYKFSTASGTTVNVDGFLSGARYVTELSGNGTIDSLADVILNSTPTGGFSGTLKTKYGLYVLPGKVTGVTNSYSIFTEGTADTLYNAGLYRMPNLVTSDTTTIKPVGVDANGVYHKLASWPTGAGGGISPGPNGTTLVTDSSATEWDITHSSKYGFYYSNDFFSPVATQNDGNGLVANNSSGTTSNSQMTASNHPGEISMATGTGTTNAARIISSTTSFTFGAGATSYELYATSTATLSDGTDSYQILAGFLDAATVNQTDGAYFLYDTQGASTGSASSANWQIVTCNNGSRTFTTTSVPYVINTYNKLKIEANAAGTQVNFFIDGTLVGTHTTDIPASSSRSFGFGASVIKSAGTNARNMTVDFLEVKQLFTTPR